MKLLSREDGEVTFLIGKREREMLFTLLKKYPVLPASHFRKGAETGKKERSDAELLEEALAEQQRDNRRRLEQMLKEQGRFEEDELGYRFRLSPPEMEWLLQVLNDIRVGSWALLGGPDLQESFFLNQVKPDEQSVQLAWSMEVAGLFQHSILQAFEPAETTEE